MVPLGLFPVLVAMVKVMLIDMIVGESLGVTPTLDTTHFPGIVVDKQNINHSIHKGRRALKCGTGQYEHPNKSHCCIKCHPGTHVAQHCLGPGQTTTCLDCHDGSYTAQENFAEMCLGCQKCRETFGQITITSCTTKRNTVCGCKVNQYQYRRPTDPDFFCKNCTACRNGTIIQQCTKYNDTICLCDRGFFLRRSDNTCSPCSRCSDGECKLHCDPLNSVKPEGSSDLNSVLGCLVVLFGAVCILLLARRVFKKSCWKQQMLTFCSNSSVQQPGESVPKTTSGEKKTNDYLLEPNQKVVLSQQETTTVSLPCQLPDCVKSAGETQIPNSHEVLYTIVDHVPVSRWKEFVRRLGLTENTIERTHMEQRHVREAQYEMLRQWRLQASCDATVERISSILNQMELSGCSEAIQEILPKQL